MRKFLIMPAFFALFFAAADGQQGWTPQTSLLEKQPLWQVQFVSSTEGWIVARNGRPLHTTDAGTTWLDVAPAGSDTLTLNPAGIPWGRPMSFLDATNGWLIGGLGNPQSPVIYKTTSANKRHHGARHLISEALEERIKTMDLASNA
jgi:photosystem II stability/assembly factor-like uncharacterized protein